MRNHPTARLSSPEITADIYRRMESATGANGWMDNLTECEDATNRKSPPPQDPGALPSLAAKEPAQPAASAKPSPLKSAKKTKKRKLKKVPHSLPFLSNTIVADIIVEEELRAKKTGRCADELWQPDEVIHFFRALYVHGAFSFASGTRAIRNGVLCSFSH